jgi:phospholipid/cholesterol/gamma-HCH transport system ATP-binding protein
MIEVINLNKSFQHKQVLFDISATFNKSNINFVLGASGCGKSVLMKCMVGLLKPESGSVLLDKKDFINIDYKQQKQLRQDIGMLFQGGALFDSLSVEDNIAYPLRMFTDWSKEQIMDRVNFCLSRVNMPNINKLFPSNLSGGMKKRVGIARAIALNPKYLFCDEPNSGLDPITSRLIDELIKEITLEYQITTIINSHDIKSVFDMADHILFIDNGKKAFEGNLADFKNTGHAVIEQFIYASRFA